MTAFIADHIITIVVAAVALGLLAILGVVVVIAGWGPK